jgi:hypothetical protein
LERNFHSCGKSHKRKLSDLCPRIITCRKGTRKFIISQLIKRSPQSRNQIKFKFIFYDITHLLLDRFLTKMSTRPSTSSCSSIELNCEDLSQSSSEFSLFMICSNICIFNIVALAFGWAAATGLNEYVI